MSEQGSIPNRATVAELIRRLTREFETSTTPTWENRTLESYLEALSAWLDDCEGYYDNLGRQIPENAWEILTDGLQAARSYE